MMIKEWFCADHGVFEGSHPICPAMGCASSEVVREIRTAPAIKSDTTKRTDAGIRDLAQSYGQSDFKSAKDGESSKAASQADGVLWGSKAQEFIGRPLTQAHTPQKFLVKDGKGAQREWVDRGGIVTASNETKAIHNPLLTAQMRVAANEKEMRKKVTTK